jgi:hypothetical protein
VCRVSGRRLAYLASAALVGYAAFHLCAALTGVRWRSHLIWVVAAGLLAVAVPKVWRQHHDSAAVARYYESQRRQVRAHCTRDRKAAAEAILKHWQARNAPTWINCASSAPVGTYGNGHRFGEIHSTDVCADVETTPFYDGGDGSRTLWFLSCRTRIDSVA